MNTTVRRGAVVVLLVFSVACGSSGPTSPSGTRQPPSLPSPTPRLPIDFPPLSGPSRTFIFDGELSYPVSDFTRESRFVLYDNGAFCCSTRAVSMCLVDSTRTQTALSCFCSIRQRAAASTSYGMMRLALSKAIC